MKIWCSRLTEATRIALLTVAVVILAQTVFALDESEDRKKSLSDVFPFSSVEFSFNNQQSRITARTHFCMGMLYRNEERFEDALTELHLALRLQPRSATLHAYIADLYSRVNDTDRAVSYYQKAITVDPNCTQAHMELARAYQIKRMYNEAIESYRTAIRLDSENIQASRELAQLLIRQKRNDEAIIVYRAILRDNYTQPHLWYELAKVYARIDRFADATDAYIKSLELDASLYPAHLGLAILYDKELGDYSKALEHYAACEEIYHNTNIHQRIEELKQSHSKDDKKQQEAQHTSEQVGFLNSSEL